MLRPLLLLLLAVGACADASPHADAPAARRPGAPDTTARAPLPYRLDAPDATIELPAALREISDLAWLPVGRLAAVQDETGTLYEIDPATGAVVRQADFHGPGDFEGVAWDGAALWALESNGMLTRLAEGAPVQRVPTGLHAGCDAEGLAWDAPAARLLVACKETPGGDARRARSVHALDPATRQVDPRPTFLLDRRALDGPDEDFKPSALARHPLSGLWYVVSSTTRTIAAVDSLGGVRGVGALPARLAPQPEGLAFAPDGTLFVSSEGRPGRLLRYAPVASP